MKGRHVQRRIIAQTNRLRAALRVLVRTHVGTAERKQQVALRHLLPSLLLLRSVLARRRTLIRGHVRVLVQEAKADALTQVLTREVVLVPVQAVLPLKAMLLLVRAETGRTLTGQAMQLAIQIAMPSVQTEVHLRATLLQETVLVQVVQQLSPKQRATV